MPTRRKGSEGQQSTASAKKQKTADAAPTATDRLTGPVIGDSVVYIGNGLLEKSPGEITAAGSGIKASKFVIVSDRTVFGFYGQRLLDAFAAVGKTALSFQIAPGESSKSRTNKAAVPPSGEAKTAREGEKNVY